MLFTIVVGKKYPFLRFYNLLKNKYFNCHIAFGFYKKGGTDFANWKQTINPIA